jgi:hypothetical protein
MFVIYISLKVFDIIKAKSKKTKEYKLTIA